MRPDLSPCGSVFCSLVMTLSILYFLMYYLHEFSLKSSLRGRVCVESAKSAWKSRWQGFRGSWYLLSLSTSLFLGARGEPDTHPSPAIRPSRAGGSRLGTWWGRPCGAAAGLGTPRGVGGRGICLNLSLRFCGPNSHTQNHTERAPCSHLGCHDRRRASGCGRSGESGPRPPGLPISSPWWRASCGPGTEVRLR